MCLLEACLTNASTIPDDPPVPPLQYTDPLLYHYVVFSDNVFTMSVMVAPTRKTS
jgi:alpha-1,4-galacturonosyltransferase